MLISYRPLLSLLLCLLLAANSAYAADSSKGIVGNINPETGFYTAIDDSFSVVLPVRGTMRYVISTITDGLTTRGTLISVEPKKNAGTYRLETSNAIESNERNLAFPEASAKTFDWYRRLAVRSYRGNLIELVSQFFEINGRPAASVIYKQLSSKNKGPRFHLFYLVDHDDKLAFVWTDIPLEKDDLEMEDRIITGKAEQAKKSIAMLRSLQFK